MYIARDLSVNGWAMSHIVDPSTKHDVVQTLDQFEENPVLLHFLQEAIEPAWDVAVVPLTKPIRGVGLSPHLFMRSDLHSQSRPAKLSTARCVKDSPTPVSLETSS